MDRQLAFHQLLLGARRSWLLPALRACLGAVDPAVLGDELNAFAPEDARRILAGAGIRDEFVFATPIVLREAPPLVGYYRLLLGRPRKSFYGADGFSIFSSMEDGGVIGAKQSAMLSEFCLAVDEALAELVRGVVPQIAIDDIRELPILTIGSQFQGANNNRIGAQATRQVWLAILELISDSQVLERSERKAIAVNSAGRQVMLQLASDPDVRIQEEIHPGKFQNKVAIEIKGGTDRSNAYNRAGEAEKSHIKARRAGFQECWTIISVEGVDRARLESDSPSTTRWFDISGVLARQGESWLDFKQRVAVAIGIPVA